MSPHLKKIGSSDVIAVTSDFSCWYLNPAKGPVLQSPPFKDKTEWARKLIILNKIRVSVN